MNNRYGFCRFKGPDPILEQQDSNSVITNSTMGWMENIYREIPVPESVQPHLNGEAYKCSFLKTDHTLVIYCSERQEGWIYASHW